MYPNLTDSVLCLQGSFKDICSALAVPVMAGSPESLSIHSLTPFVTPTLPHGTDHSGVPANIVPVFFFLHALLLAIHFLNLGYIQ